MFKTGDVAKRYHVSKNTVRTWVEKGYLSCTRLPCGDRQFSDEDLQVFEEKHIRHVHAEGGVSE